METIRMINISIVVWGCVFGLIAAFCIHMGKHSDPEKRKWMILLQLAGSVVLGADAVTWHVDGLTWDGAFLAAKISNFIVFAGKDVILLFFHRYICSQMFEGRNKTAGGKKSWPFRAKLAEQICLLGIILVVISQFVGLYYYYDAKNVYHRTSLYLLSVLIPLSATLLDVSLLIQHRRRISRRMMLAMAGYIVFPMIGVVIQTMWYGVPWNNFGIELGMVLLFVMAIDDQNRELERLARRQAKTMERLEIAATLNRCVTELSGNAAIDESIYNLLGVILDYFEADRTYIFEMNEEQNLLLNTYEFQGGGRSVTSRIGRLPAEVIEIWMKEFQNSRVYYISDVEQEKGTPVYDIMRKHKIERLLAAPLVQMGETVGFLGVENPRRHVTDETLLSSLRFFVTNSLERKKEQERLKKLSYQDTLTGLYNRNKYIEVLKAALQRTSKQVGAAYIDLNGLKQRNDHAGHEAGDDLLCRCAEILAKVFPGHVYRVGGDEFIIGVVGMTEQEFYQRIALLRERLQEAQISVSLGALWQEEPENLEAMMQEADRRMYAEKEAYYAECEQAEAEEAIG